ncbi:hypothetical protein ABL78_1415 [Leptomonas seymouri]|uniref:Uncharacterized protein n=1 Tax=Leptomonas seymouri TaxID=5684 RepID=A0A0N1PDN6_LEPSE|nr:hypothetical protein ABL78_1415 [Leptomonas seymouri]|eukprot:KPI89451.1 hypothetical protein ABL78_1415 [Leptomonas seymouri]
MKMSTVSNASLIAKSTAASPSDEAEAISAGYARGHTTVHYTDCKRLPSMHFDSAGRHASTGISTSEPVSKQQGVLQPTMQLGDFSFLPHPEYAGRSGKTVNKPLYLHRLMS